MAREEDFIGRVTLAKVLHQAYVWQQDPPGFFSFECVLTKLGWDGHSGPYALCVLADAQ